MTEGNLPPSPAPPEGGAGNPWERRDQLGFLEGLVENIKLFVTSPTAAFDQTRRQGDFLSPVLFAVLIGWASAIVNQLWNLFLQGTMLSFFPQSESQFGFFALGGLAGFMVTLVLSPVFVIIGLFILALLNHVFLLLVGGMAQSESGFEGSVRAVSYSSVAQLCNLVPVIGWLVGLVWGIVLTVIGLSRLHDTTLGKATAAVLLPVVLCCCLAVAVALIMGAGAAAWLSQQ